MALDPTIRNGCFKNAPSLEHQHSFPFTPTVPLKKPPKSTNAGAKSLKKHPNNPAEHAEAEALNERLVQRALDMDGTCTGEHGIGLGKQDWLVREIGEDGVDMMRTIKKALDPQNLFNPGKIFAD